MLYVEKFHIQNNYSWLLVVPNDSELGVKWIIMRVFKILKISI